MAAGEEILKRVGVLEQKLDRLLAHLGADRPIATSGQSAEGRVASLQEIGGERGDPKIRMVPKRWTGEPFKGYQASECSPDFLDCYAEQLDWFANKNADQKKAGWDRLDAARCRRWALEIREGRYKPRQRREVAAPPPTDDGYEPSRAVWSPGNGGPPTGDFPPPPEDDGYGPPPEDDMPF